VTKRILIVEDSSAMRAFVRSTLEDTGTLEVLEAHSGFDALRMLPREQLDLVITDINKPDINGLELISFMRRSESHRATPLLIISTEAAARDRERALSLGADAYLTKPFGSDELSRAVEQLLAGEPRKKV